MTTETKPSVLVATTLAAYVMDQPDTWGAWLRSAEAWRADVGAVDFFAAIEVDARGLEPFTPLIDRLRELGGTWWTFNLDDGRTVVTTGNRLRHITVGQNLASDAACSGAYTHMLFVAADCAPPPDALGKLVEVGEVVDDAHVVGAYCPTYCLPFRPVPVGRFPLGTFVDADTLCFSAAAVLLDREAFRKLRWRWDADAGMSDDPCLQHDAWYNHGWPTYVRLDVEAAHFPQAVPAIELRGHDMTVVR